MKAFKCKRCDRISYSASSDVSKPCVYCQVGAIEPLDEGLVAKSEKNLAQSKLRSVQSHRAGDADSGNRI